MKLTAHLHGAGKAKEEIVELIPNDSRSGPRKFRRGDRLIEVHVETISPGVYSLILDGRTYEAYVSKRPGDAPGLASPYVVAVGQRHHLVEFRDPRRWRRTGSAFEEDGPQEIVAPMPGKIVKILVAEGQQVERGQGLLVIEAMKMQNELRAARAGKVERIYMTEGSGVESGARLIRLG